jgi:hypothetical protein
MTGPRITGAISRRLELAFWWWGQPTGGQLVADDHPRSTAPGDHSVELAHDPPAADRAVDDQGEGLAREVVHDRQNPEPPAPGQHVGGEG